MKTLIALGALIPFSFLTSSLPAAPPVVSNVRAAQRVGTALVDIVYDVSDPDGNSPLRVSFQVSADAGATWTVPVFTYQGAVGPSVVPGLNRAIVWSAGLDWTGQFTSQCRVRVVADDGIVPPILSRMVLIPAGSFEMGNSYSAVEGFSGEIPVHSVFVSAFYMETNAVTKALWDQVKSNTSLPAYQFDNAGATYGTSHPVQTVSWFDVVKWCNARSETEHLTPVYYTDVGLTTIYRSGQATNPYVKWSANGYRLPTEAEREKAACGGLAAQHFPWPSYGGLYTAYITCSNANYSSCVNSTKPVGSYPANGYGLNDMAGNVWEWCWDWSGTYPSTTQFDPRGPSSGAYRILRGGSWFYNANFQRCAVRLDLRQPALALNDIGFRCVRGL